MDGIVKVDANYFTHITTVTFNPKKILVDEMREELGKQGFHVQGEPTVVD